MLGQIKELALGLFLSMETGESHLSFRMVMRTSLTMRITTNGYV